MRAVFGVAARWLEEKRSFALATLVALRDAATAPIGTTIAVDAAGRIVGNVGAGCHEAAIVDACLKTAADGRTRGVDIDLSEDELLGGNGCGARMQVVAWRPGPPFVPEALAIAEGDRPAPLRFPYEDSNGNQLDFEYIFAPRETLIVVGATSLAEELCSLAQRLDFRTIVVDPRAAFATAERVPSASTIVRSWPNDYLSQALSEHASIVMLSHDPKFDVSGLRCALKSRAPYIGLLGSRRSQEARRASLRAEGFGENDLARIHGPAGLDLGARTVAETAVSILAEIVAARRGGAGVSLRTVRGPIHRPPDGGTQRA